MNPAPLGWFYVYTPRPKTAPLVARMVVAAWAFRPEGTTDFSPGGLHLLRSKNNGATHIGCTRNLQKRLGEHCAGKNYSTRKLLPLEIVYFEDYRSKEDAFRREKHLKYHSSGLRNLKIRLYNTLCKGGAG